jgi:hypothetical protein
MENNLCQVFSQLKKITSLLLLSHNFSRREENSLLLLREQVNVIQSKCPLKVVKRSRQINSRIRLKGRNVDILKKPTRDGVDTQVIELSIFGNFKESLWIDSDNVVRLSEGFR